MFSNRFYFLCFFAGKMLNYFSICTMNFNREHNRFGHNHGKWIKTRIRITYTMFMFWGLGAFYATYNFRKQGDLDRFNLTLAYWLVGGLANISISLLHLRCHDLVLNFNGLLQLMTLIHRKPFILLPKKRPESF